MDTTVATDDTLDDAFDTAARPWQGLPDVDLPDPELSTAAWDGPLPAVEDHPDSGSPLGMVVGGSALGLVILGLGVFSAFGLAGVAATAAVAAVTAPAAAVGVADFRRRVKTGQWRPSGARASAGSAHGRLRQAATPNSRGGGMNGIRAGRTPRPARTGTHRSAAGRASTASQGGSRRAGKAGLGGKPLGLRRAAASLGLTGRSSTRKSAKPSTGGRAATGIHPARGGARPTSRAAGRIGAAMRRLTGSQPRQAAQARRGNGRRHVGLRPSSAPRRLLSSILPGRGRRAERHRSTVNAAGMTGLRGWRAARASRRENLRQQRATRAANGRTKRWERRDKKAAGRRKWIAKRRKAVRRRLRKTRRLLWRTTLAAGRRPLRRCADGFRWVGRWAGRRSRRAVSAVWTRIVRSRAGRWAAKVHAMNWGSLFLATMAHIGALVRSLIVRIPGWLGAPTIARTARAAMKREPRPDHHDDERDSDAPAVARPGRRPRPVMAVPAPVGKAPAVATPRSNRRNTMSGAPMHPAHQAVVDAFREAIGGWQPPDEGAYEEYEQFFGSWQEMFEQIGDEVAALGHRFRDETPLETAPEYLHEVATGLNAMGEAGNELYESWRDGNAADIGRHENPRPNEKQLNVV
ncbi:hypothetical protein ACH4T9_12725 [Micromonospora sp. NPDC020750]|uniref:hypothetical protein n=1 Tax=unclassified Micromonospora TaxID=2617518 RepID=UPI0037A73856